MFELLKLAWDAVVLRDSIRKGEMTAGAWAIALLFLLAVICIGLPTILYYDRHPDASAQVMFEAAGLLALVLMVYFWFGIRWRLRLNRERLEKQQS
jgi:hypothetical protein